MKTKLIVLGMLILLSSYSCKKRTCRCVDMGGHVTTGININATEECSDLEPMMGDCTEE
jgi:hypothetical protein